MTKSNEEKDKKEITLDVLPVGETGTLVNMDLNGTMRRRLQDLGLIPGTKIVPTKKSPGKGPTAYKIRDSVYALRQEDSCRINVTLA